MTIWYVMRRKTLFQLLWPQKEASVLGQFMKGLTLFKQKAKSRLSDTNKYNHFDVYWDYSIFNRRVGSTVSL